MVYVQTQMRICNVQANIQDVVPSRSCASTEWHGACPSAGTFTVRLEGPATLWGVLLSLTLPALSAWDDSHPYHM